MKILYHHRIAARDGMDVHKSELIKAFRALGHEVIEVGPTAQQKAAFGDDGGMVDVVRAFLPKALAEGLEVVYDQFAWVRLKRAYLEHRPDILYERHNLFLSAGKRLKQKYGIPFYLEVNAPLAAERAQNGGLALSRFAHAQEGAVWRAADRIFPVTKVLASHLTEKHVEQNRIQVMPNAVDTSVFHTGVDAAAVRRTYNLDGKKVLGFTGFIRDWHGLDLVIDALPDLVRDHNVHVLVVGDGPAREALEIQARDLGVAERVHFTGIVSRADIPRYIAAFDIALQPAVTPYASPLKLFEYLAMGKCVLAPDCDNIREVFASDPPSNDLLTLFKQGGLAQALTRQLENTSSPEDTKAPVRTWQVNAARIANAG